MMRIYLDYAATTPLAIEVFEAMRPYFLEKFGNASSFHKFGQEAKAVLEESRSKIAKLIGVNSGELYFVSGGTEANNTAIKGIAIKSKRIGKNHIITSKVEHHAVLDTCEYLERNGFAITYLNVDKDGFVDPSDVKAAITEKTCLISIMLVNNETGVIMPVREIGEIAKQNSIPFHTDAVQAFGKIPVNVNDLNVDLLSLSAHKLYGPKGVGAIYVRKGIELEKIFHGGGQERGFRAGTESVPLAFGFARAAELATSNLENEFSRIMKLKNTFLENLKRLIPHFIINGDIENTVPNILSISFDSSKIKLDGEALLLNLDLEGIAVASGSACTSGSVKPSHVISAMGRDLETAKSTIRFSFGKLTTEDEIRTVLEILLRIINRIGIFIT